MAAASGQEGRQVNRRVSGQLESEVLKQSASLLPPLQI